MTTRLDAKTTVESWVGRDPQKYVPGFYWLTLLPEALAKKHGVPFAAVEQVAQEHIELEGGQHFFRFYKRPEDWVETPAVTELCASLSGVFYIEKVKPQLLTANNFLELNSMLRGAVSSKASRPKGPSQNRVTHSSPSINQQGPVGMTNFPGSVASVRAASGFTTVARFIMVDPIRQGCLRRADLTKTKEANTSTSDSRNVGQSRKNL